MVLIEFPSEYVKFSKNEILFDFDSMIETDEKIEKIALIKNDKIEIIKITNLDSSIHSDLEIELFINFKNNIRLLFDNLHDFYPSINKIYNCTIIKLIPQKSLQKIFDYSKTNNFLVYDSGTLFVRNNNISKYYCSHISDFNCCDSFGFNFLQKININLTLKLNNNQSKDVKIDLSKNIPNHYNIPPSVKKINYYMVCSENFDNIEIVGKLKIPFNTVVAVYIDGTAKNTFKKVNIVLSDQVSCVTIKNMLYAKCEQYPSKVILVTNYFGYQEKLNKKLKLTKANKKLKKNSAKN